ncbi:unnamed protein product [Prorocentrum cordatum]|uniref:peptidylprolyl isomerase n=1 Tax=Prorocentrum cordatum TaxID=2364126 RepID=A0ABN9XI09_9DINO|nr:unnamed protein product [Polarella glacialis]
MALRFHWSSIPISIVLSSLYFYYITRHKKGKPGGDFKKNKAFKDLDITVHQEAKSCTLKAGRGDLVHVHYTGYSKSSGKKFETTRSQSEPYVFKLGQCNDKDKPECLKGFEKSIFGMCAGEKRISRTAAPRLQGCHERRRRGCEDVPCGSAATMMSRAAVPSRPPALPPLWRVLSEVPSLRCPYA